MEFLKVQFARIQEQLNGLSSTQKMLTASLVVIMLMTLAWWSRYAAEPEMVSLLPSEALTAQDMGQMTGNLDAKGISYRVVGDSLMVPTDRRMEALAALTYAQALPRNGKSAFDEIVKNINPLSGPDMTDRMLLEAKQRTLSEVICNFPGAANAMVVIDPTSEQKLDGNSIQPSAMVTITTRHDGKASPKQLAFAAADVVSGAVAGLSRSRINVVIDGMPITVPDNTSAGGMDMGSILDTERQFEKNYCDKIRDDLGFINGLMVSVTVKLNTATSRETVHRVIDPKNVIHQSSQEMEETTDSTGPGGGGEAGTVSNIGQSINGGGSSGTTSNTDKTQTSYNNDHGVQETEMTTPPGDATPVAASVRVPRSYFVQAYKNGNGGKEPSEAVLAAYTTSQLDHIRKDVKACTNIASDDSVVVGDYSDAAPVEPVNTALPAASPVAAIVTSHGKEIGVGVLAAISLFMVSMMVRKSSPVPVLVTPEEKPDPGKLPGGEELAGEVAEGGAMLDGMELDEDAVKTQQMLDQVQHLVAESPDAAANLVKRWLNRT